MRCSLSRNCSLFTAARERLLFRGTFTSPFEHDLFSLSATSPFAHLMPKSYAAPISIVLVVVVFAVVIVAMLSFRLLVLLSHLDETTTLLDLDTRFVVDECRTANDACPQETDKDGLHHR